MATESKIITAGKTAVVKSNFGGDLYRVQVKNPISGETESVSLLAAEIAEIAAFVEATRG